MGILWSVSIRTRIYNLIKDDVYEGLKKSYPNIFFTTTDKTPTTSKFPTVYIDVASMVENGQTLENNEVSSLLITLEVKVLSNNSSNEAMNISNVILNSFKKFGFDMVSYPIPLSSGENVYQATARYRKNIADMDKL